MIGLIRYPMIVLCRQLTNRSPGHAQCLFVDQIESKSDLIPRTKVTLQLANFVLKKQQMDPSIPVPLIILCGA